MAQHMGTCACGRCLRFELYGSAAVSVGEGVLVIRTDGTRQVWHPDCWTLRPEG